MTENNVRDFRFRSADPLEELASDLWSAGKSISAMSDQEQLEAWRQAVEVLHDFGKLAETLHNDPLLLAVTDAKGRAEEEYARSRDRVHRPEGAELGDFEKETLTALLRRSDALNSAVVALEDWSAIPAVRDEALKVLKDMRDEAGEAFERYRLEAGLPEPGE